jgi:hypothetical protein
MTSLYKDFYGDQSRWFIGTVTDITDPLELGRVKVRVDGVHDDTTLIPANSLPWAQCLVPITQGGTNGLGNNLGIQINARVFGFFLDGTNSQMPIIFGSIPKFEEASATGKSTNQLAIGVSTLNKTVDVADAPIDPYAAVYPNNNVYQTKSGHVIEIDDTENAERIHVRHKSGSFIEIHPDGKIVVKAEEGVFIDAGPKSNIKAVDANIEITGTIDMTAAQGDIVVDGVSLTTHTHTDPIGIAGRQTSTPN